MHLDTILGLISDLEHSGRRTADQIRAQIAALTSELAQIGAELAALAATRSTLRELATTEFTADEPAVIGFAYQQILTVLGTATTGMRAKDICLALDIEPLHKNVEGTRAKLKRLVNCKLVTESETEIFALLLKRT